MGVLFECSSDNIGLHLKHIFQEGELEENSVTEYFSATASDGKNYRTLIDHVVGEIFAHHVTLCAVQCFLSQLTSRVGRQKCPPREM